MYDSAPADLTTLQQVVGMTNIADHLTEQMLSKVGIDALQGYSIDKASMSDWLQSMKKGIELAKLVKKDKNYPFPNCSNVKYPLITSAALQFNGKAYPAIVASEGIVKAKVYGSDPSGAKAARGERVAEHMSWQFTSKIEEWETETDKLLVLLPIVGQMFRKVWYDTVEGRPRCRLVDPGALIVNEKAKSLSQAPRISEEIYLFPDEVRTRVRSGQFREDDYLEGDERHKKAELFIEQHCRLDLDQDGYEEPYIVTLHKASGKVARIVADFEMKDLRIGPAGVVAINRNSYFVSYQFLPGLDGGFFGTGFGLLLGDISESINTTINMMMDAGHMASMGGGFIGSEFRIKGKSSRFNPGEWKTPAATGGDIRSSIVPITFPGPDATLFQLLGLMIEAGKEVASVKDVLTGDTGGKQMTATTTLALIEQGMAVFTAVYKRIFRSLKQEFKLVAETNAATVTPEEYNQFHDAVGPDGQPIMLDPREEYNLVGMDIEPVADPNTVTKMQAAAKAQVGLQMAEMGMVDKQEAANRMIEAMSLGDVEALAVKPNPMDEMMGQMSVKSAEADLTLKLVDVELKIAEIEKTRAEAFKTMEEAEAQAFATTIDAARKRLEGVRDEIQQSIATGFGPMASGPGGQGGSSASGGQFGGTGAGLQTGLLDRPAMAGGAPFGPPTGAGAF